MNKTQQTRLFGILSSLLVTVAICGCASSGHSSENFKTQDLNSCASMGDNQKDIDKIQTRIDRLNRKMNDQNEIKTNAQIESSQDQIQAINRANATQVQNCGPVVLDASR